MRCRARTTTRSRRYTGSTRRARTWRGRSDKWKRFIRNRGEGTMSIEIEVGLENATKAPKVTEELELEAPAPKGFANPKVRRGLILGGIVLVAAVVGLLLYYHNRESTDDAQVDGHITPMASKVYGRVAQVLVEDNQAVKAGQVLVKIDPRDYQAALDQAKAALALAESGSGKTGAGAEERGGSQGAAGCGEGESGTSARGGDVGASGRQAGEHENRGCAGQACESGASASFAGSGATELELHGNYSAGRRSCDAQAGGDGTDRASGTGAAGGCAAARRVGDGQFQGDATEEYEGRTEGGSESGYVWEDVQRACGFDRGGHGVGAEPAAAGKRDGELRESGAADSREDRAGPHSFGEGGFAAGDECGRDGDYELTGNKDRDCRGST